MARNKYSPPHDTSKLRVWSMDPQAHSNSDIVMALYSKFGGNLYFFSKELMLRLWAEEVEVYMAEWNIIYELKGAWNRF